MQVYIPKFTVQFPFVLIILKSWRKNIHPTLSKIRKLLNWAPHPQTLERESGEWRGVGGVGRRTVADSWNAWREYGQSYGGGSGRGYGTHSREFGQMWRECPLDCCWLRHKRYIKIYEYTNIQFVLTSPTRAVSPRDFCYKLGDKRAKCVGQKY